MNKQEVILCNDLEKDLLGAMNSKSYDKLFILTDENTELHCLPAINKLLNDNNAISVTIPAGDLNKNMDTLAHAVSRLQQKIMI